MPSDMSEITHTPATPFVPRCVRRTGTACGDCVECLSTHPDGQTCADCVHTRTCLAIWGLTDATQRFCDWQPSRFTRRVPAAGAPA